MLQVIFLCYQNSYKKKIVRKQNIWRVCLENRKMEEFNLQDGKQLVPEVQKYKCMYDKS